MGLSLLILKLLFLGSKLNFFFQMRLNKLCIVGLMVKRFFSSPFFG